MLTTEDYIKYKFVENDIKRSSSNYTGGSNDNSGCGIFILIFIVLALFGWLFS